MKRIVALAERRPWVVVFGLCMIPIIVCAASLAYYVRHESRQASELARQSQARIEQLKAQDKALTNAFIAGCRVAVGNARDADLAVMEFLQSQLQGRTAAVATVEALQQIVKNKENPDVTCVRPSTKENP